MYEYEIRNGIAKGDYLRMGGVGRDIKLYVSYDYSKGSVTELMARRKTGSHSWKICPSLRIQIPAKNDVGCPSG